MVGCCRLEEFLIFAPRAWQLKGQIFVAAEGQQGRLDYVSRLNMLVISEYYFNKSGTERENEKRKKKILRNWQQWKNNKKRSNNRRFISEPWNLPKGIIQMGKA